MQQNECGAGTVYMQNKQTFFGFSGACATYRSLSGGLKKDRRVSVCTAASRMTGGRNDLRYLLLLPGPEERKT